MATVFARLKLPGVDGSVKDEGVHAFIVPLRDPESKECLPGVRIHDNGYKAALFSLIHTEVCLGCSLNPIASSCNVVQLHLVITITRDDQLVPVPSS